MFEAAERESTAIVMNTNIIKEYEDGRQEGYPQAIGKNTTGLINGLKCQNEISHTVWAYFFKNEFLKSTGVRFPEDLIHEDFYFQYVILANTENIYLINSPSYHYMKRSDSIMGLTQEGSLPDRVQIIEKIYEYLDEHYLLDRVKVPFYYIQAHIAGILLNTAALAAMRNLFARLYDDVNSRQHLYSKFELLFFNKISSAPDLEALLKIEGELVRTWQDERLLRLRKAINKKGGEGSKL